MDLGVRDYVLIVHLTSEKIKENIYTCFFNYMVTVQIKLEQQHICHLR